MLYFSDDFFKGFVKTNGDIFMKERENMTPWIAKAKLTMSKTLLVILRLEHRLRGSSQIQTAAVNFNQPHSI